MADLGTGRGLRWWWVAILSVAIIAVITVMQCPVDREVPRDDVDVIDGSPGVEEIDEGDEIRELDDGPLDRPPGTAPADPRRPSAVPPGSDTEGTVPDDAADDPGALRPNSDDGDDDGHFEVRSVPSEDGENSGSGESSGDGESPSTVDEWAELQRQNQESNPDGDASEGGDDDSNSAGDEGDDDAETAGDIIEELDDDERRQLRELADADLEDEELSQEELERLEALAELEAIEESEELMEQVGDGEVDGDADMETDADDDMVPADGDDGAIGRAGTDDGTPQPDFERPAPTEGSATPPSERASSEREAGGDDRRVGGSTGGSPGGESGGEAVREEPSSQAFDDYRDVLDEAGDVGPDNAANYASMATRQLAESLFVLSAGRTMPEETASEHRDDIIDSTDDPSDVDDGGDARSAAEDDGAGPDESGESGDDAEADGDEPEADVAAEGEFDEEWTVWLDVTDWLRSIQQQEYPELAGLVDDVEAAAEAIDPTVPEAEQIDELVWFFETVEIALEAMAEEEGHSAVDS